MKPVKGSSNISIPITFDGTGGTVRTSGKSLWTFLVILIWIFISVVALLVATPLWKVLVPLISFVVGLYIFRYLIIRERYFRAKREELIQNEYLFPHSVFWDIQDISSRYPYIVRFASGIKGVFVALDKDVIVGKDDDYSYYHHEAIASAYQQMSKRNIECMHIDFMDTVGKDTRLSRLFSQAESIQNEDLRKVIMRKYDYIEATMNKVYASYDVYCFYSNAKEDIFWEDLQVVLAYFKQANFVRARVLDSNGISAITKSLLNIDGFSFSQACDELVKNQNSVNYLRVIWTENNGERVQKNKTLEEIAETRRVAQAEKKVKKKRKGLFKRKKDDQDINLFD